ncbi:Survival motor neuron [Gossypium australe]|uniref:Survival motor neuron n=1 Tax=Gossypium australe TaxID=47621 RepID=A0A5B6US84_9ROSI|nr:Survival motor neuron [Gossypium australe]
MGKESELWDDSALIDAFDNAMSKYKKMHGKKNSEANVSVSVRQTGDEAVKDAGENSSSRSNTGMEIEVAAKDVEPVKENHTVKLQTPETYIDSSTSLPMQDKQDGNKAYSDSQAAQDYNQLLTQYYEVEDKRQMILQQLQQFGSWNYQYSGEGSSTAAQWGTSCASQEYPIPTSQALHSTVICSCCPYACQSLATTCTSYPCCSLAGTSVGKISTEPNGAMAYGNLPPSIDSDIVKTAMGAAERAISSMKTKASINPNVNEENKEKKDGEEEMNQSTSCETDLTVLLNAWYSAGFYTGKYLVEQSIAKRRQ